jgi:hypothetical protein
LVCAAFASTACVAKIDGDGNPLSNRSGELRCDGPSVAQMPLRRLTREQYDNAVRDLLGASGRPSLLIPQDEKLASFTSNAVTATSRLAAQQYAEAAEQLAETATPKLIADAACNPAVAGAAACAGTFIERFGRRAYRRPLSAVEKGRYERLFSSASTFADGIRLVVTAMLQSVHFLYHLELPETGPGEVALLAPYQLASRLSFALWNTIPDEALLAAAAEGRLASSEGLRAEAARLLADDRAADAIRSFHVQWLNLDALSTTEKDGDLFPEFDAALRTAMLRETETFVDHVIRRGDGKLSTLLTAPFSFAEGPLLELYGGAPAGTVGQPARLDPAERAGLLTQAAFLSANAHANQSSPIRRGLVIRQNLLCEPLPDPPANVNNTPPNPAPDATTRQRFLQHTVDPSCAECHALIDPVGFGFENYDAIGRYRSSENGLAIDAHGEITRIDGTTRTFNGAVELAHVLAESPAVRRCTARQWFRFALGRAETPADTCSLERLDERFANSGFDIRELLLALVTSDAFRYARRAAP